MASIVNYSNGLKRIEFSLTPNGPRKIVRLGRVNMKAAESWKAKIEAIISDKLLHRAHEAELAKWLGELDETMLGRLRDVGLADGVGIAQTTLGAFLDRYANVMTGKPATRTFYGHTIRNLKEHFGAGRLLRNVTPADADGWRAWLVEDQGLSAATVARRIVAARTMWRKAMRWKLTAENPFVGIKAGHQANESRKAFIPREVIDRIIAEAPDAEWRVIIALARYGGLRCPSEHYALRWGDVSWDRGTIRVPCPKLAHIEHLAYRTVPLFPELREHLLTLLEEAEPGTEYVISRHRLGAMNLRQQFKRIIKRAGETPWAKLFHNLRASRETELMREYDLATVCKWIGNSPTVAAKHYATSVDLDADFRRAAGLDDKQAQQNAQQSPDSTRDQAMTDDEREADKPLENKRNVRVRPSLAHSGNRGNWALQDSNL